MVEALVCSCLQYPGPLVLAVCFYTIVENLIAIAFHLSAEKKKMIS